MTLSNSGESSAI